MIDVKIVADSLNEKNRLTTFELIYPRYIHAQMLTHRVFSRNTASSRAIPTSKLIEAVQKNPVIPKEWGANQSGMQSYKTIGIEEMREADSLWMGALHNAVETAKKLSSLGVHKQIVNRILEPFAPTQVILSGTEFDNFFNLRRWKKGEKGASQHEIAEVAEKMFECLEESKPVERYLHIPYYDPDLKFEGINLLNDIYRSEIDMLYTLSSFIAPDVSFACNKGLVDFDVLQVIKSLATCARISYTKHTSQKDIVDDIKLAYKLYKENHCSPFEHIALQWEPDVFGYANFKGWMQLRTLLFCN